MSVRLARKVYESVDECISLMDESLEEQVRHATEYGHALRRPFALSKRPRLRQDEIRFLIAGNNGQSIIDGLREYMDVRQIKIVNENSFSFVVDDANEDAVKKQLLGTPLRIRKVERARGTMLSDLDSK